MTKIEPTMNTSTLTITSVLLIACLIWMDTCLYFSIQAINNEGDKLMANKSEFNHSNQESFHDYQNHYDNKYSFMNKFSYAFQGMSVKLMMTDPVDNYLLAPLSEAFVDMVNFKDNFWFITPNIISYAGVVSALIAAKLVSYDSSTLHKLSYVMFQVRTWLDDLDGAVARTRLGIHTHVSLQKTPGYVIDGVCDAIGFVAYIIGCYVFMKNTIRCRRRARQNNRYNLQSITEIKSSSPSTYIPLQQECEHHHHDYDYDDDTGNHPDSDRDFNSVDEEDEEDVHFSAVRGIDCHHDFGNSSLLPDGGGKIYQDYHKYPRSKIYLEKIQNGKQSTIIFYRYIKEKLKDKLNRRKLLLITLCFLLQIAMCATFWNRYILVYRDLLESPSQDATQARMKSKVLKSNIFYIIIWFWRLTNGHSLMQLLIASVFIGKLWQFLDFIKYIGFLEIILLATTTELHIIDVRNYLN